MTNKTVVIPIYNWTLTFIELEDAKDADIFSAYMKDFNCNKEHDSFMIALAKGLMDIGLTKTIPETMQIFVAIFPSSSPEARRNTINHEKRHIEDEILELSGIEDKEAAGYLAGYLSEILY
ncbi:MAG: hypothetical protein EOL97_08660 [Spirochaetia bacterium]|nr:hypothetical protein [Spirochaetia bacterium]